MSQDELIGTRCSSSVDVDSIERSSRTALVVMSSESFLPFWLHIASYCPPRTVCNLEALSRPVHEVLSSPKSGGGVMQKYWHAQCFVLRWCSDDHVPCALSDAPTDERKRRLLQQSLSKPEAKKHWKLEYRQELESYLRRNLRGLGVHHQVVVRSNAGSTLSTPIVPIPDGAAGAMLNPLSNGAAVDDDAFVQMCVDGGLSLKHFTSLHGSSGIAPTAAEVAEGVTHFDRQDYKKNCSLGKRRGKHGRGKQAVWATWVQEEGNDE